MAMVPSQRLALARPQASERVPPTKRAGTGPLSRLVVFAFVAFTCSMPFEAALLLGGEGLFSISRLVGYGFFGLAFLRPGISFRKPPRAFWFFLTYFGIYLLTGLYQPAVYWPEITWIAFRLTQFFALFWVAYSLFQIEYVTRWSLWALGLASVGVGALLAVGVGVSQYRGLSGRQTVFGQGPNTIAAIIALGGVALIGLAYGKTGARQSVKAIAWGGFLVVAVAITRTGSRGALVGLAAGLLTLLASHGSAKMRLRNAMIVILALGACAAITIASSTTSSRWNRTIQEGNLAGRDRIFRSAFFMIIEKPILGWGPASNYYELGRRLGLPKRDTHNLILWLLTEQGLLGAAPFFAGLILCARAAWRARRGSQGLLPLALFAAVMCVNLAGTYYVTKWFWFVMAYALASATHVGRRRVPSASTGRGRRPIGLRVSARHRVTGPRTVFPVAGIPSRLQRSSED